MALKSLSMRKKMIYMSGLVIYVSLNANCKLFLLFILGKKKKRVFPEELDDASLPRLTFKVHPTLRVEKSLEFFVQHSPS